MVFAVIDTNILVSALISHNSNASTVRVVESMFMGLLVPMFNDDILAEYEEVLHRKKFRLTEEQIHLVVDWVKEQGVDASRIAYNGDFPDEDDRVFYEVSLSREDSFLVTGNLKHFPKTPRVVTAAEMIEILGLS